MGPHERIETDRPRDRLALKLFDRLWDGYRRRVSYVQMYEQVVRLHGGTFVNDHIAFRTLAHAGKGIGIATLGRIFEALGYQAAGTYAFEDKHLGAIHYQHPHPQFPKLFVSELKTWEFDRPLREIVERSVEQHRPWPSEELPSRLHRIDDASNDIDELLTIAVDWFTTLPWPLPQRSDVEAANAVSQYAAWVLLHGYNVNHFTSLVNSHGVENLDDIEKTASALRSAGVPMKAEFEGERGSKLRQTATEAVTIEVQAREGEQVVSFPWTYAYFELAQRDWMTDAEGRRYRFEGFLGSQATALFEMTRKSGGK